MSEPESGEAGRDEAQPGEASPADSSRPTAEETAALLKQLTVGTIIDAKYQVDEVIGKGAMGVVIGATHVHLKERVALKFLSARPRATSDDFHTRFRREAQVSAKLRNEHITRVIDVGVWREKVPFMVMDLLVGQDLRQTLRQAPRGRLPPPVALDYIVQVCEGLAEAHSHGIVHRDLKPSNLFVTKRHDGTDLLKILDFGISKWSTNEDEQLDELTQTGVVLGSPKYMAPEQLFGSASVDARADVWSLGAIFYEMLTGRPPYDYPTLARICAELATDHPPPLLTQLVPDLPRQLEAVVMQCFVRDREQRVSSVAELAGALLESVEAPFAGQVRQRIASMLDPKGQGGAMTSSSGASLSMSTSNYRSLAMSGSTPSISSSSALRIGAGSEPAPSSAVTAGGVEALVAAPPATRRTAVVLAAIIGALAALALAFAFVTARGRDAVREPQTPGSAAVAAQPSPAPTVQAPTVPAITSPAPTAAAVTGAPVVPGTATAPSPAPHGHGVVHHGGPRPSPPPPPPAPVTAQAAPPPPPAAPAPAPTPAPPKANPLEDRQ